MNRFLGTYGTISKGLIFMLLQSQNEKKQTGSQKMSKERMAVDLLNMVKDINLQIQEAHQIPNKTNSKTTQIIIKLLKTKDKAKNLEAARENQYITYRGNSIRMNTNFSTEIMQGEDSGKTS